MHDDEKLGRPPVMRPNEKPEPEVGANWRGEHLIRIKPVPHGGGRYAVAPKKSGQIQNEYVAKRRAEVKRLHGKNMPQLKIAKELKIGQATVARDLIVMGLLK
jgi:hypothetical protein